MTAISPPSERLWWKHPLDRVEGLWISIAFVWCMVMFFMMVYWHMYGSQNLSTETYKTTPEMFTAKTQAMVDQYTVRRNWTAPIRRRAARRQRGLPDRAAVELLADPRAGKRQDLPPAHYVDGLQPRLLAAAGEHQHPDRSGL
jgi:hypothetical protein